MKYTQHTKGFTLVETLIAITILILVVIGPVTIAQQGIKNARYASEEMTATFLAQEGVEGVRSFRDAKALDVLKNGGQTRQWISNPILADCLTTAGCYYDNRRNDRGAGGSDFRGCGEGGSDPNCTLYVQENGEYTVREGTGSVPSIYRRKVLLTVDAGAGAPDVVKATVEVKWNSQLFGGAEKEVVLQTYLYDHYQRFNN